MSLWARLTWSKAAFGLLLLNLVWTASLFVAPFTIPPGSFAGEVGGANMIDHADVWGTFPPYTAIVYAFGDIQCHQLWFRSLWLNGNQMPLDARMTSMYVFANLGLLAAMFAQPAVSTGQVILNALPRRLSAAFGRIGAERAGVVIIVLGLLPIAVDGFTQLFGFRESTDELRLLTGAPGGFVGGLLVGAMLMSIRQVSLDIRAMRARIARMGQDAR
ncbi:MAG: hypothetical protein A3K68_00930 [Euryarchaeota archaeon RBG_16_68_13]|nr:MAG: hypothetical protein A3K68_00930 [Euryarchaeota archaeon RBG_16_68_13]